MWHEFPVGGVAAPLPRLCKGCAASPACAPPYSLLRQLFPQQTKAQMHAFSEGDLALAAASVIQCQHTELARCCRRRPRHRGGGVPCPQPYQAIVSLSASIIKLLSLPFFSCASALFALATATGSLEPPPFSLNLGLLGIMQQRLHGLQTQNAAQGQGAPCCLRNGTRGIYTEQKSSSAQLTSID
jgi:hypothetical protein